MTETAFYILLSLLTPMHGYAIMKHVATITNQRVILSAGTMYGTLQKLERTELIRFVTAEDQRKIYQITPAGRRQLTAERARLGELMANSRMLEQ
ncbi:PadR family transcriptional regulator [Lacticaseibacillus brantae]|uniref:Transcription regulator PadR N-terminal domain-containing protein n=1 Tax=Lacticaseibacillus brantae DSM 23927 TaxID=1423727 RepID=A0A0R2AXN7_9LACO|nr:PadR family transcriptional regulator [Lacticaseibacillus brantae]KRM72158.1 hypothetical protein FC34_GL001142 [Lacticaseibacillus brantae DSM 23927]